MTFDERSIEGILHALPNIHILTKQVLDASAEWTNENDPIVRSARAIILQEQVRKLRKAILLLYEASTV